LWTKLLVLGLGEPIVTTCGQARTFLGKGSLFGDETEGHLNICPTSGLLLKHRHSAL